MGSWTNRNQVHEHVCTLHWFNGTTRIETNIEFRAECCEFLPESMVIATVVHTHPHYCSTNMYCICFRSCCKACQYCTCNSRLDTLEQAVNQLLPKEATLCVLNFKMECYFFFTNPAKRSTLRLTGNWKFLSNIHSASHVIVLETQCWRLAMLSTSHVRGFVADGWNCWAETKC